MNTTKISNIQVFWITFSMESAITLFLTQSLVIQMTKQDAWISFLIGVLSHAGSLSCPGPCPLCTPSRHSANSVRKF